MFSPCEPQQQVDNRNSVLDQPEAKITFPVPDLRSTQLTADKVWSTKKKKKYKQEDHHFAVSGWIVVFVCEEESETEEKEP